MQPMIFTKVIMINKGKMVVSNELITFVCSIFCQYVTAIYILFRTFVELFK
jgi:hypothetical protein